MSNRIEEGVYKGRGIEGSAQQGVTSNGTEQVALDIEIPALGRAVTTFLYFSDNAAPYSLERLRALGWEGGDDPSFPGISKNEVDVSIKYENYQGEDKLKVEIVTGGGRVVLKTPMSDQQRRGFMARLAKLEKQSGVPAGARPAGNGEAARAGGKIAL